MSSEFRVRRIDTKKQKVKIEIGSGINLDMKYKKGVFRLIQVIHSVINPSRGRHSRESGNPGEHWIPGQARNDKLHRIYVVMYRI